MDNKELREKISEISCSEFPLIDFFNDIALNDNEYFDAERAYEDIEKIYDVFMFYINKCDKLEKKYQKLEETFRKRAELCSEFAEYISQDEKVFDFLIDKFNLELKGNRLYFLYNNQYFELDKEEEKLMKEELGYE